MIDPVFRGQCRGCGRFIKEFDVHEKDQKDPSDKLYTSWWEGHEPRVWVTDFVKEEAT